MIHDSFKCDVCGKIKGEVNKWFVFQYWQRHSMLMRWDEAKPEDIRQGRHLCGRECALKVVSVWMED